MSGYLSTFVVVPNIFYCMSNDRFALSIDTFGDRSIRETLNEVVSAKYASVHDTG